MTIDCPEQRDQLLLGGTIQGFPDFQGELSIIAALSGSMGALGAISLPAPFYREAVPSVKRWRHTLREYISENLHQFFWRGTCHERLKTQVSGNALIEAGRFWLDGKNPLLKVKKRQRIQGFRRSFSL